ncbi:MAG: prepilin peptidase, partial [Sulfurifustaceae bacterium]
MLPLAPFFTAFPVAYLVTVLLLGLIIGSFLNVVIHRLPVMLERDWRDQCQELAGKPVKRREAYNLVVPRSQCPSCGHRISAVENIPLLSYAWLRGKCKGCGKRISLRYPIVELVTGLLSLAIAAHFGVTAAAMGGLLLTWVLIALTFIDYDHQLLPDNLTLPLLWLGLVFNLNDMYVPIASAVVGAMAGYISLWLVYQLFKAVT